MPIEAAKTDAATSTPTAQTDDGLPPPSPGGKSEGRLSDEELVAGIEAELAAEDGEEPPKPGAKKPDEKKDPPAEKKEGEIEVKLDPAASKAIEATNRYRAQVERQLQQRDEAIAKREADLAPRIAKAEAYEKARADRDPLAVAEALGYGVDELEGLAQTLYKMSKSASPADRAAAAAQLRQRQTGGEVEQLRKTVEELTKSIQERDVRAKQEAFVQQYTAQLASSVTDDEPLVKNALKNAGQEAQRELQVLAARMEQAARGVTPEPSAVVKEYEKRLRLQAQALGFDPTQIGKPGTTSTTTTPTPESGQKKTTAGLTQDLGPQTRSRSAPKSRDEAFEETERELEELARKSRRT